MFFSFCTWLWLVCGIIVLIAFIYDTNEKVVAIVTGITSFLFVSLIFRYHMERLPDGAEIAIAIMPIISIVIHGGIGLKYKIKGVAYLLLSVFFLCFILLYLVLNTGINENF